MGYTLTGNVPGGSFVVSRSLKRWTAFTLLQEYQAMAGAHLS
jgi:hypothetical protein